MPQPSLGFTEDASKKRRYPASCSVANENASLMLGVEISNAEGIEKATGCNPGV